MLKENVPFTSLVWRSIILLRGCEMNKAYSNLKLNIIFISFIWSMSGLFGILKSLDTSGLLFYIPVITGGLLSIVFLFKRYNPYIKAAQILVDSITLGETQIFHYQIIRAYEVGLLGKLIFALKCPKNDYCACIFKKGIIIKTLYDGYMIDDTGLHFTEVKKSVKDKSKWPGNVLFYILLLPVALPFISCALQYRVYL
jgi:hypothetical protein